MRRFIGHVLGLIGAVAVVSLAPRIMDRLVCALAMGGLMRTEGGCSSGSAGLGEGGLHLAWNMAPSLLGLIAIMEVALWLQRLYSAPTWVPPVVVVVGCPLILGVIAGLGEGLPWFLWELGVVMGLPVALAFTAYWLPLRLVQQGAHSAGGPQNNKMQLTSGGLLAHFARRH